jgi:2-phospho-L-lactate/phosphoenolpyruvate guanylyltransferase
MILLDSSLHHFPKNILKNEQALKIAAVVPVKSFQMSKSRLAPFLSDIQRQAMSQLMLNYTLSVLSKLEFLTQIIVVSCDEFVRRLAEIFGAHYLYNLETGVNSAVTAADRLCFENGIMSSIIIPADLCFLSVEEIRLIYYESTKFSKVVAVCPSKRRDGTNFLLRKPLSIFKTSYDNNSYYNHLSLANNSGAHVITIDSENLERDIDIFQDVIDAIETRPTHKMIRIMRQMLIQINASFESPDKA